MLYGIVVLGSFIVQTETEAVTAFDFQLELHILFQFHFKQLPPPYVELNSPQQFFGIMTSFSEKSASYNSFRLTFPI